MEQRVDLLFAWASTVLDTVEGEPAHLDLPPMVALRRQVLDTLDGYVALDIDVDAHLPDAVRQWYRAGWR